MSEHAEHNGGEKCERRYSRQHVQTELQLHADLLLMLHHLDLRGPVEADSATGGAGVEREGMVASNACQALFDGALRQFFP